MTNDDRYANGQLGGVGKVELRQASPDDVMQDIRNCRDLFYRHDLSMQAKNPLSFFEFFYDVGNNLIVKPRKELENWLLNVSSDMLAGSDYHPTMDISEAVSWRMWCNAESNAPWYNLLMQVSPAFKSADMQARLAERASRYRDNIIPGREIISVARDEVSKMPGFIDALSTLPQAAGQVADVAGQVWQQVIEWLSKIWQVVQDLYRMWVDTIWPAIQQMWDIMRENMKPALDVLNQDVLQPFRQISTDGKVAFEEYRKMVEDQGRRVDASVPPIVGPNIDEYAKILPVLAKYFNLPIFGDIAKAELQVLSMMDYQATQMRGFATPLKMLEYAAGMSAPAGPGQALADLATKPPQWFLSNI